MVKVEIKKNNRICVSGHALFADFGNDIVCAGISAVIFGALNALDKYGVNDEFIEVNPSGFINIDISKFDSKQMIVVDTLVVQLQTIEEQYPEYIMIES